MTNTKATLLDLMARGYVTTQTSNLGVHIACAGPRIYRLAVCDHASGWDVTGPVYPTKSEAFADVDRVALEYYA